MMIKPVLNKMLMAAVLVSLLIASTGLMARQQNNDSLLNHNENTKPQLDGHKFINNSMLDGPFVNTFFRLTSGVGNSSNYDLPLIINGEEVEGLFGQITYGAFHVKYQHRIKNWMAFAVSADVRGRLGSQTVSLITEGLNLGSSFNFGWIFKGYESRKLMISGSLTLSNNSLTVFNMQDFLEKIIQNGGITEDNKLVKTINLTAGIAGLSAAYAFNRTFGCMGKVNAGYGESISGANKGYFDAGVSFDADLDPKFAVPIGFVLGYNWNNFTQGDVDITNPQNIIFRISYTGRKDFDLGLEMSAQFYKIKGPNQDINLEVLFAKAGIAYFF